MGVGVTCPKCRDNFAFICSKCHSVETEIHEVFEPINYFQTRSPYYLKCRMCQAEFDYALCPQCKTQVIPEKPFVTGDRARGPTKHCFIASACLEQNSLMLDHLYLFRDEILKKNKSGRLFIKIYYIFSPALANAMNKNVLLRTLMKYLVVCPAGLISMVACKIFKAAETD